MPILTIEEIRAYPLNGRAIAWLDLGTKTVGLAVCDLSYIMAHPRPYLRRKKFRLDAVALLDFFRAENIGLIVIGQPLNMDGSSGARVQSTRSFVSELQKLTPTPFVFWDERLSTVAATRFLLEQDMSRAKRKNHIDSAAAVFILQGFLDYYKNT